MDEIAKALGCMLSPYLQYFYLEKKMFMRRGSRL